MNWNWIERLWIRLELELKWKILNPTWIGIELKEMDWYEPWMDKSFYPSCNGVVIECQRSKHQSWRMDKKLISTLNYGAISQIAIRPNEGTNNMWACCNRCRCSDEKISVGLLLVLMNGWIFVNSAPELVPTLCSRCWYDTRFFISNRLGF